MKYVHHKKIVIFFMGTSHLINSRHWNFSFLFGQKQKLKEEI
jgi:hypothetical protein